MNVINFIRVKNIAIYTLFNTNEKGQEETNEKKKQKQKQKDK